MFKSNNTGDFVTRDEARTVIGELNDLTQRVSALESLAAQLRRGQSVPAGGARVAHTLPVRTPFEGVTKAEASEAYRVLMGAGKAEFRQLNAKIDSALSRLAGRGAVVPTQAQRSVSTTVDYGAVAFGLSQIKRDVANVVGSEARTADLAAHYAATVQYFADVFAKSDPTFDADAFKRESGV